MNPEFAPKFQCVIKRMLLLLLTWQTSKSRWISELMTMVLGITMAYGVCGYVCKNKVEILSRKKRPKCRLSGGAKLYCLQKAYHALKSSPDFRRLIVTLEGIYNTVLCIFDDHFQRNTPMHIYMHADISLYPSHYLVSFLSLSLFLSLCLILLSCRW